jgi:hypothetical protein
MTWTWTPADVGLDPADYQGGQVPVKDDTTGRFVPGTGDVDDGGSGGSDDPFVLTGANDGGWGWFTDARAVHADGKTFFGYLDGGGSVCVRTYDHTTGTVSDETVLAAAFQTNLHANPSLLVRQSDQRLLVFWSAHNGTAQWMAVSEDPLSTGSFSTPVDLHSQLGSSRYTYTHPVQMDDGTVWLFYRRDAGGNGEHIAYSTSTDGGTTWAPETIFANSPGRRCYVKVACDGQRIDVAMSDGHPSNNANVSLFHAFYDGTGWSQTDGTAITLPLTPSNGTLVHDGTTATSWACDVAADPATGRPRIVFATFPTSSDHRYQQARWDGTAWTVSEVAASTTLGGEAYDLAGASLDHDRPDVVYTSEPDGSGFRIVRNVTADDGATWDRVELTDAAVQNVRPATVRNSAAQLRVLWMSGTYTSYLSWNTGTSGTGQTPDPGPDPDPSATFQAGADQIDDAESTVEVEHGLGHVPETVLLTPRGNELLWVPDRDDLTFTAARAGTSGRLRFDWLATGVGVEPIAGTIGQQLTVSQAMAGTVGAVATDYVTEVLADGPVAYWRLNETTGTTAADEQSVEDGTYSGNYTLGVTGPVDLAVQFPTSSPGMVDIAHNAGWNTSVLTVETWAATAATGVRYIVMRDAGTTRVWQFRKDGSQRLQVILFFTNGGIWQYTHPTTGLNDGSWHHLALTYDGTGNDGVTLYSDGTPADTSSGLLVSRLAGPTSGHTDLNSPTLGIRIARSHDGSDGSFRWQGPVAETAIYDKALSAGRIAAHIAAA